MRQIATLPDEVKAIDSEQDFSWAGNPSVQKLLDVVAHILATEYVRAVKENPALFREIASGSSMVGQVKTCPTNASAHSNDERS